MPVPLPLPCSSRGDTPSSKINNTGIYKSSTLILEHTPLTARSHAAYFKPSCCAPKAAALSPSTAKATYSPDAVRRQQLRQVYDCRDQAELAVGCSERSKVRACPQHSRGLSVSRDRLLGAAKLLLSQPAPPMLGRSFIYIPQKR